MGDKPVAPIFMRLEDGTAWPDPTRVAELDRNARYGDLSRGDVLELAGVAAAYLHLCSREYTSEMAIRKLQLLRKAARRQRHA